MDDLREKVIKGLECCTTMDDKGFPMCEECPYSCEDTCPELDKMHRDALTLLKAQEPKKPEVIMINGNGIQSGSCPCCGETVNDYRNEKYCGKCGQRLRWLE